MLLSLFLIGMGFCFVIGWFDQSLQTLTYPFSQIQEGKSWQEVQKSPHNKLSSQVKDPAGQIHSLKDITGKVTLLSFWASWCGLCRVELPSLATLHEQFTDQGLQIVAINVDGQGTSHAKVTDFWQAMNLPFDYFSDFEGQVSQAFDVQVLPTHFVLNQQGEITLTANGANDWSHPKNINILQDILNLQ